jgi:hypothetical protein
VLGALCRELPLGTGCAESNQPCAERIALSTEARIPVLWRISWSYLERGFFGSIAMLVFLTGLSLTSRVLCGPLEMRFSFGRWLELKGSQLWVEAMFSCVFMIHDQRRWRC